MFNKFIFLIFVWMIDITFGLSQPRPSIIDVKSDAPEWVKMMLEKDPDVVKIKESYDLYYTSHPFAKNAYTQYYKKFMRWARPLINDVGKIEIPTNDQNELRRRQALSFRKSSLRTANWTFNGPNETWHTNGVSKVTWQTNIYCIDVAPSNSNVLYAGGETGGVWKTEDKGLTWVLKTKNVIHDAFGAIKIHPTDANVVYAGTSGKIIKSTNGGDTWTSVYIENGLWTNEIAISASNPNIVIAATDSGVLRSTNGGSSWTKLFTNQTWTIKKDVSNTSKFYLVRKNGSSQADFMTSIDSGATWIIQSAGWYQANSGEVISGAIIATCPSNSNKLYTYLCGNGGTLNGYIGVFVSADGGTTWSNTNPSNSVGGTYSIPTHTNLMASNGTDGFDQGFYDMAIVVNPNDENQLIAGGTSWFKSVDGGITWNGLGGYVGSLSWSHPDMQWIVAAGNDLWITTDGGINYSTDFATTIEARMTGVSGADMWGFGSGWNTDLLVGGRYHNGNMAWHESFPNGKYYRMGGAEAATGYVNPGPGNKVMHSDIGGHKIKNGFGMGVDYFSVSNWPNESYAYYANSDMAFHPNYYNTIFIGKDNTLMKSTDGGGTFAMLYTFPGSASNDVYEIQIARSNPNVMYCSQWDGTDDKLWKSTDGGSSWTAITPLPLPNNNDRVKMAVSSSDPNVLWVAVTYGSDGKKIYKTTNGGTTWANMTTTKLNGVRVSHIMAQFGTDGGVYLGTNAGVLYRNNTLSDWEAYSTGLPMSAESLKLRPFYRDGKLRNGTFGFGVWESPLYEPSLPEAMPTVNVKNSGCVRDTMFFDDYSVLEHNGATWLWSFPGASYVSSNNIRNPKVLYPQPGDYDVTLTITNALNQTSSKTIVGMINISNKCEPDTIPGKALMASGTNKHGYVPDFNFNNVDSMTITAWVKPSGIQPDYSAIMMSDGNYTAGLNFREGNNTLAYHWPSGQWWWDSNIIVPADQWSFVAMVVKATGITVYCNEQQATHNFALAPVDFSAIRIGSYRNWESRNMNGLVDEVAIYNRSLSTGEIRDLRHLTKKPSDDTSLIAYYQFNTNDANDYDKVGTRHISMTNGATKETSGAPVGGGTSQRISIVTGGLKDFGNAGAKLYFPISGTLPNGEIVVTRINQQPNILPNTSFPANKYWVINNYGTNTTFASLDSIRLYNSGNISGGCVSQSFLLSKRLANSEINNWINVDNSDYYNAYSQPPFVTFSLGNSITSAGQLFINLEGKPNGNPTEICNGVDDDCDSLIDESYSLEVSNNANSGANTLRAIINCAQNGETITFAPNIDTITLLSPIVIDKNLNLLDANGNKVVIKGNLTDAGFNNAAAMISLMANKNITCTNLHFIQANNNLNKPVIMNYAHLTMTNCDITGNPDSVVKHAAGASFQPIGLVKIE